MRNVIAAAFVSLDGVMQAPGTPEEDPTGGFRYGGWNAPLFDAAVGAMIDEMFAAPFALLLGRKTYEIFAAHWPYAENGQHDDIAKRLNAATKYVATTSRAPLTWHNSIALHDAAADVARLKREDGPTLLTQGSSVLMQTLLTHGLIDAIHLLVFPLMLGAGKRFFGANTLPAALKLERSTVSPSGVTMNRYRIAGPVKTGSFALETPSAAELARRERMRREG